MIKLLHAADLHMDSPFDALSEHKAARRRSERRAMLSSIVELAEKEGVGLILLAGDILDSESARRETAEQLSSAFSATDIPVFISPGNHDYFSPVSPYHRLRFPENVHIFKRREIECVALPDLNVRVWGAGFTENTCPPLLTGFEAEKQDSTLDIMCIHGEVGKNSDYNPITVDELARSGMDYVALGHIHSFSGLCRAGDTVYAWPGCPEGRGFDETGKKGVIIAGLEPGSCELRFVPMGGRRYEIVRVGLSGETDHLSAILRSLPGDAARDIYRIILTGECERAPDLNALGKTLEDRFFSLQLRDSTEPKKDLWEGMGSDTLCGLFLTRLKEMHDRTRDAKERDRIVKAVRWGLAALEDREEPYADQ